MLAMLLSMGWAAGQQYHARSTGRPAFALPPELSCSAAKRFEVGVGTPQ